MTLTSTTSIQAQIDTLLRQAFPGAQIRVEDESEGHRGHAGWREGGQTHFHIALTSPKLAGLSRIARHRAVHAALGAALIAQIHALRMTLSES
jgi:BolA family transcriptional regulator, general stress-responsive regulator